MSGGYLLYSAPNLLNTYIKKATETEQSNITKVVTKILDIKKQDPAADTTALEAEIDQLVYQLYGLTEEEIAAVEGR